MKAGNMNMEALKAIGEHFLAGHVRCSSPDPMLKYAWGLRELFSYCDLYIDEHHSLAPASCYRRGVCYAPIYNGLVRITGEDDKRRALDSPIAQEALDQARDYWQAYDVDKAILEALSEAEVRLKNTDHCQGFFGNWQGHATIDYRRIMNAGLVDCKRRIAKQMARTSRTNRHAPLFYTAASVVLEGIESLILRNIEKCEAIRPFAKDDELERIRRLRGAFEQMLNGPPRHFFEALQFTHFFNAVDGFDNVGRLDQYLFPFYRKDLAEGDLDEREAEALLTEAFEIWGRQGHWQIVIGGLTVGGSDAANELTTMIMKARRRLSQAKPSLSLRVSEKTRDEVFLEAFELLKDGVAQPAFYNEELYCGELKKIGVSREDAVEFVVGGCSETHIAGKGAIRDEVVNVAKALEALLCNGRLASDGRFGMETGEPESFKSFDSLFAAYKRQVEYIIDTFVLLRNRTQEIVARLQPALIRSLFISDCIEKGLSHSEGGARYTHGMANVCGIPNVANSLCAIKSLVFDKKLLSMSQLVNALRRNFHGHEEVRRLCLKQPKYGNDADEVDLLARNVSDHVFSYLQEHRIWHGGIYYAFCASFPGLHITEGKKTGATADGRLSGSPLANSMGPVQGTDTSGPLALFNSVTKVPLGKALGTPVVNVSFSREVFDLEHRPKMLALIRAFFKRGGMQLQLTVLDRNVLLEALEYPEKHRNLFVRVSGYSARFVDLGREYQEEIIARTVF